jgi:cytochrome c5
VNKFINSFLSKKRNVAALVILVLIIIGAVSYTVSGIQKNVLEMAEPNDGPVNFATYPKVDATGKDANLIKRGEYLVKAGDCIACHTNTPEKGKAFAGGLPMQTPFGTIYSPNLTPDKETGIGKWTNEQFIKAMREGISPSGHHYYPAFPYLYFNKVTTEDLLAIKAYFDNIPAVNQPNLKNKMVWPFNWRFLQFGWRLLFFNPTATGPFKPDPKQTAEWNRGAYLVEGLGHCAMCHTPSYHLFTDKLPLGAPIQKYNLIGSKIQGYLAPNITKANIGNVSREDIYKVFKNDKLIGGGSVEGPMLEANHDSLVYLTQPDVYAIATYLQTVESKEPPKPSGPPGKNVYDNYCAGCHTTGAGGAPKYGDAFSWNAVMKKGNDKVYENALKGFGGMPAKGTCLSCSTDDIKQAVDYMELSVKGKSGAAAQKPKKLTMKDGQRIYQEDCSVCHSTGFKGAQKPGDKAAWKPVIDKGFLDAYLNIVTGRKGHPPRGSCPSCTDDELLAAIKYMMQQSATDKNYNLW